MVRGLILMLAIVSAAPVSLADTVFRPPAPGTLVTWSYTFDNDKFIRVSEVVASGEDFVIYDPNIRISTGNASEYLVEFSGIHVQTCDEPLPADDDRAALKAMWPFVRGASATVKTGHASVYKVGEQQSFDLISTTPEAGDVWAVEGRYGSIALDLKVSPALGMPVEVAWRSGGSGHVLEVAEPQGDAGGERDMIGNLGECEKLLN
ncbi:hypothetical protein [Henriciella aquimarina]|uniref:hypothetical protein n=1 Tax=Henriciella aquimarina TaxID=545261 RepID=UPI0009FD68F9|nr:hypothetical protein [Henriciella aquimarina]